MTYQTIRHRWLDSRLIIRKTIVYTLVAGLLLVAYLGIIIFLARMFEGMTKARTVFPSAITAGILALGFQSLWKRIYMFIDAKFFRQYVAREEKLYELSRDVVTHTTPEAMAQSLTRVLEESFHPKSAVLYLRSRGGSGFTPAAFVGKMTAEPMPDDHALPIYFSHHPQPFVQDSSAELGAPQSTRRAPYPERGSR